MTHATNPSLKRDLVLVAWNSNGVFSKIEELKEFLARLKPDVLLINETHLRPHDRVRLPNYVFHGDDRVGAGRARDDTAIEVKTSIGHHRLVVPSRTHLEATAIELPRVLGGALLVSTYKPPSAALLDQDLDSIQGMHRRVILAGDLNCKHPDWDSRLTTTAGRRLHNYLSARHLTAYGPRQPTHYPQGRHFSPDVLDIAVVKGIASPVEVTAMAELSSDHCPILVHVAIQHLIGRDSRRIIIGIDTGLPSKEPFPTRFP